MSWHFETEDDLRAFLRQELLTTPEAMEFLGVSRQRLNILVKEQRLTPVKEGKTTIFLRSELEARSRNKE